MSYKTPLTQPHGVRRATREIGSTGDASFACYTRTDDTRVELALCDTECNGPALGITIDGPAGQVQDIGFNYDEVCMLRDLLGSIATLKRTPLLQAAIMPASKVEYQTYIEDATTYDRTDSKHVCMTLMSIEDDPPVLSMSIYTEEDCKSGEPTHGIELSREEARVLRELLNRPDVVDILYGED